MTTNVRHPYHYHSLNSIIAAGVVRMVHHTADRSTHSRNSSALSLHISIFCCCRGNVSLSTPLRRMDAVAQRLYTVVAVNQLRMMTIIIFFASITVIFVVIIIVILILILILILIIIIIRIIIIIIVTTILQH